MFKQFTLKYINNNKNIKKLRIRNLNIYDGCILRVVGSWRNSCLISDAIYKKAVMYMCTALALHKHFSISRLTPASSCDHSLVYKHIYFVFSLHVIIVISFNHPNTLYTTITHFQQYTWTYYYLSLHFSFSLSHFIFLQLYIFVCINPVIYHTHIRKRIQTCFMK